MRSLDLEDAASVRAFASAHAAALARARRPLRALVNNAGVMGPPDGPDGRDRHLWANHLGPYLLTRLLMPAMPSDGSGRVVNVASRAHYWGRVGVARRRRPRRPAEPEQPDSRQGAGGEASASGSRSGGSGGGGAGVEDGDGGNSGSSGGGGWQWEFADHPRHWFPKYCRSKLCNVLFTRELQRRYGLNAAGDENGDEDGGGGGGGSGSNSGSGSRGAAARQQQRQRRRRPCVTAAAVSPGMVATPIFSQLPWPLPLVERPMRLLARSPAQGAATAVWAATAPEVTGAAADAFLHDCRPLRPSVSFWGGEGGCCTAITAHCANVETNHHTATAPTTTTRTATQNYDNDNRRWRSTPASRARSGARARRPSGCRTTTTTTARTEGGGGVKG